MESFPIPGTRGRLDGAGSLILLSCDVGRPRRSLLSKGRRALALCGCDGGRRPSGPARRRARTRAAGGDRCRLRCGSSGRSDSCLDALAGRVWRRSLDDLAGSLCEADECAGQQGNRRRHDQRIGESKRPGDLQSLWPHLAEHVHRHVGHVLITQDLDRRCRRTGRALDRLQGFLGNRGNGRDGQVRAADPQARRQLPLGVRHHDPGRGERGGSSRSDA